MSELALNLIEENKKTRATFLDLGNCGLTEVPMEISELVWLEELSFSNLKEVKGLVRKNQNNGNRNEIRYLKLKNTNNPFLKLTNLRKLWLNCNYGATSYSPESLSALSSLKKLEWLDFSNTRIDNLSGLTGLTNLKYLDVSNTKISNIYQIAKLENLQTLCLSCTWVDDLSPLRNLTNLKELYVFQTRVADLSPLIGISKLERLSFGGTFVSDMTSIAGLTALKELNAFQTRVTDLTPLTQLTNLQDLNIGNTPIVDFEPLTVLTNLTSLFARCQNPIGIAQLLALTKMKKITAKLAPTSDLSPLLPWIRSGIRVRLETQSFWISSPNDIGITIDGDHLVTPPAEIVIQGNEAILNYFEERQNQGVDHLYEAKLLIVGEGGAGKTSLLRRLYQTDRFLPEEAETTKGIDIHRHEFKLNNGRNFRLNVWDFGGQEIYHATHQFFLTKRSLYVLLDDTRKDNKTVQDEGFKYWLEVVDQLSDHSPVLIFQNEKGGRSKTIDEAGIKGRFNNVKDVFSGNLEFDNAADKLKDALEYRAQNLPHIGEELPARWVSIRAEIETLAEQKPHISQQSYFDLYSKHLEFDRDKALFLSRYLHDLGVFLHFQDDLQLAKTVILQNTWATEAVFKMLDDEIVKAALGRFTLQDCQRVWQDSAYADMHAELLALMQKFELCYRLPDAGKEAWLAPQLLPPSKPPALTNWEQPGDLLLRYRYDFMPKGLVSRLMVRMHRFVLQPELGWVTGVLFERDGNQVLVEIPPKGREIAMRARGPERKELLSVLSADLDALNESFRLNVDGHHEKVEKLVPCNCKQCRRLATPESYEQKRLLQRKRDGKLTVECPTSYEDVDVLELLDGIRSERLPLWDKEKIPTKQLKIFISYSHAQYDYFPIFKEDFTQYAKSPDLNVDVFGDDAIPIGASWDDFLQGKVAGCDVMVLLVSQEFINSKYIQEKEFGDAIKRLKAGSNMLVVPIYFAPCSFASNEELARLQFFKPNGDQFNEAQKGDNFVYIDLVKFRQTDGQPIPNSNSQHYMMELMQKLKPELQKLTVK